MINKRLFITLLCSICCILNMFPQATFSPYSILGLGEIETRDYGRTAGMSNIGIGVREFDYLNMANPAGISGLDSLKFIFDLSIAAKQSFFSGRGKQDNTLNGNMKKIAVGFRILPGWGISMGTKPFSDLGYKIVSEEPIEGSTSTKSVSLEGSGGFYELYLSNGIKVTDFLSVGIHTKFISGILKQDENQTDYIFEKESRVKQLYNTFGIQYHRNKLTIGATYGYKQDIVLKNKTIILDNTYSQVQEHKDRSTDQFIPETFGVGFSFDNRKTIWGMDFQYQRWEGIKSGVSSIHITDFYRINAGVGYSPKGERYYRVVNQGVRNRGQIQLGASLSKSYIRVGGEDAYHYSISAGYSLPLSWNLLNIALEYENSLSAPGKYIKESYFMLTFNCSIIDQWFRKRKFD